MLMHFEFPMAFFAFFFGSSRGQGTQHHGRRIRLRYVFGATRRSARHSTQGGALCSAALGSVGFRHAISDRKRKTVDRLSGGLDYSTISNSPCFSSLCRRSWWSWSIAELVFDL